MVTVKINVSGKVQGVWYRASAKDKALELGLKGKVWNEPDGSVGIIVQGPLQAIQVYIEWCKIGPPLARVHEVEAVEIVTVDVYPDFDISRK